MFAQDKIVKLNTEVIDCRIREVNGKFISYSYENEDLINTISKNIVKEIILSSGRTQLITEPVVIKSDSDWEKVKLTTFESDVEGLERGQELSTSSSSGFSGQGKTQAKAIEKIKRLAASSGYHMIFLLTTTGEAMGKGSKSSITGVGYKY